MGRMGLTRYSFDNVSVITGCSELIEDNRNILSDMTVTDTEVKSSWADDVEDVDGLGLPANTEEHKKGLKIITEYGIDDDGKKFKVVRTYKIEVRQVAKAIAQRKNLHKFGSSKDDKPGPNPATTIVTEDVSMQFITNKEDPDSKNEDDPLLKLKSMQKGLVKCRICKEDHWTTQCPYKDTLLPVQEALNKAEEKKAGPAAAGGAKKEGSAYVAPALREGGNRRGETMATGGRSDEGCTVELLTFQRMPAIPIYRICLDALVTLPAFSSPRTKSPVNREVSPLLATNTVKMLKKPSKP